MAYAVNTDVYRVTGLTTSQVSAAEVDSLILEATAFVDRLVNTTFETKQITRTLDGNGSNQMLLDYWPLVTLDALTIDGTSVTTSKVFKYLESGKIILKDTAEETIFKNTEEQQVVIQYTYGYNLDFTTPSNTPDAYLVTKVTSIIAGMAALVNQIGGTFNDVTAYTLPELTVSKGEPFTNIRETIMRLNNEYIRIVESEKWKVFGKNIFFA